MNAKHTPEPRQEMSNADLRQLDAEADAYQREADRQRDRLHAAAPDLLAACKQCLRDVKFGAIWDSDGRHPDWVKRMRAAVRKAEGGAA